MTIEKRLISQLVFRARPFLRRSRSLPSGAGAPSVVLNTRSRAASDRPRRRPIRLVTDAAPKADAWRGRRNRRAADALHLRRELLPLNSRAAAAAQLLNILL
ncbi:hypothetical protein EVAR_80407_1 [Eumeta japonica]|uniref:Uncharacterized protein n=1 Tax=Eumeta variegata TaxID=151549 RepID=A0A4C1VJN0_EUMVA|nr:hypothetical protein EVAR_80407_1 [Eumeta japonica]